MNRLLAIVSMFGIALAAEAPKSYTGDITDSMCVLNHKMMKITPDSKCVRECVKNSKDVKYVLYDGKNTYKLSDQKTPGRFAAQKVRVTGTLFSKTGVIKVDKIEVAK
ncbi:MAG TPA: hypothetical protein VM120_09525 [Bryobacteraceae bacterium]|nr:hypothetical protein [Bryobacteraceae bacterium]